MEIVLRWGEKIPSPFFMLKQRSEDNMNDIINSIRLDVNNEIVKSSISVRQNDTKTRIIRIVLTNASSVIRLENAVMAMVMIKKPDGNECYNDCVIQGDEIQYTLTSQTINVIGTCECQVQVVFDDESAIITPKFKLVVYNPILNPRVIESMNEYNTALAVVSKAQNFAQEAENSASQAYSSAMESETSKESSREYSELASEKAEEVTTSVAICEEKAILVTDSVDIAKTYALNAETSATMADDKAADALTYRNETETMKQTTEDYLSESQMVRDDTKAEADRAMAYRQDIEDAKNFCEDKTAIALDKAEESKSYAVGGTGYRQDEDVDNAAYYYEQTKRLAQTISSGSLIASGTITFAELASAQKFNGAMYNISDDFVTDSTFKMGAGFAYSSATNVYWIEEDGKWDCLAGINVVGIKGDAEQTYRKGNVNITKTNIGLGNVPNVATDDQTPTFTQATIRDNLVSGERLSATLGKISKFFADLKSVAFSANYSDLNGTPDLDSMMQMIADDMEALDTRIKALENIIGYPYTPSE